MGKAYQAHIMMIAYPAQGHVLSMLELAHTLALATHGHLKITFVNTEFIHQRIVNSSSSGKVDDSDGRIRFVSIPDGLEPEERDDTEKFMGTVWRVIPQKVEELLMDQQFDDEYNCLVFDQLIAGVQQVAEKMRIRSAVFISLPAAALALQIYIPKLIEDGIIDNGGTPLQNKTFQLEGKMPMMNPSDFFWHRVKIMQTLLFDIIVKDCKFISSADRVICNSAYDLEQGAFSLCPQIIPIGPLIGRGGNSAGSLWKQDLDSLEWLDKQPPGSVIYAAFGSLATLGNTQFQELALGLEQTNRPFLWVVRLDDHDHNYEFPQDFCERVTSGGRGRIIGWAPQQKVLSHPSTACFLSHCGWNSTVESVTNGVPMLCWPHFADQFINQSYVCDIWRVGLQFETAHGGIITSEEIKNKVDILLGDDGVRKRAVELKEKLRVSVRGEEGNSYKNLMNFITWVEEKK